MHASKFSHARSGSMSFGSAGKLTPPCVKMYFCVFDGSCVPREKQSVSAIVVVLLSGNVFVVGYTQVRRTKMPTAAAMVLSNWTWPMHEASFQCGGLVNSHASH